MTQHELNMLAHGVGIGLIVGCAVGLLVALVMLALRAMGF